MPEAAQNAFVLVESRDLDTDARETVTLPAIKPASETARARELQEKIATVHPDAKFRSFAQDVVSALGRQHLIVAHYVAAERSPLSGSNDGPRQGELFAA